MQEKGKGSKMSDKVKVVESGNVKSEVKTEKEVSQSEVLRSQITDLDKKIAAAMQKGNDTEMLVLVHKKLEVKRQYLEASSAPLAALKGDMINTLNEVMSESLAEALFQHWVDLKSDHSETRNKANYKAFSKPYGQYTVEAALTVTRNES